MSTADRTASTSDARKRAAETGAALGRALREAAVAADALPVRDEADLPPVSRMNGGLYTSDRQDWQTPQAFFDIVDAEFGFTLDAAAEPHNAKCERYWTPEDDGLAQLWEGVVWCNPPYGRTIGDWVRKGWESAQAGATVVMLIPARTDTAYWHDFVMQAAEVRLIRGRLVFGTGEARANAPFPSALVVFKPRRRIPTFSSAERGSLTRRAAEVSR